MLFYCVTSLHIWPILWPYLSDTSAFKMVCIILEVVPVQHFTILFDLFVFFYCVTSLRIWLFHRHGGANKFFFFFLSLTAGVIWPRHQGVLTTICFTICLTTCAGVKTFDQCDVVFVGCCRYKSCLHETCKKSYLPSRNIRSFRNMSQIRDHDMFHDMFLH